MSISKHQRITGSQAKGQFFRIRERSSFDAADVVHVLNGRLLGVIFRKVIDFRTIEELARRFWENPGTERREDSRFSYYYLGSAYFWNKPLDTYLNESQAVANDLQHFLDWEGSPYTWLRTELAHELANRGVQLRTAEANGRKACRALVRAWNADAAELALEFAKRQLLIAPHEDATQCTDPQQTGFEIRDVMTHEVCAVNICLENDQGGQLLLWNIRPDLETRRSLNILHSGYPYPTGALCEFEQVCLDIDPGDIYVFNGGYVHAVNSHRGVRTTVAFFIGFKDGRTVITWT